jgi:hypothetical protein
MGEQTGASGLLGCAISAQGSNKEPSPTPAALSGRRKHGKKRTIDEYYAPMNAYVKTTSDSDFIHSTRYSPPPFEVALVQLFCRPGK